MNTLTFGVIGTSRKVDEHRIPIHPDHLLCLPENIRRQLIFEEGYGEPFDISDAEMAKQSGGVASRHSLLAELGNVILAKPVLEDLEELREGGILWGYPHCVQQRSHTQTAINRRQTLIGFEDMFVWSPDGQMGRHTFYKNNEMVGYCAVLHSMQLRGIDGYYGNQREVSIFSFGAVSRIAIYALKAHGFRDITIFIQRPDHEVREEVLDCHYVRIREGNEGEPRMLGVEHDGTESPMIDLIREAEIIVNGTLQEPDHPLLFVSEEEVASLMPGCLIIDVSCDEDMGFFTAKPTSFLHPMFKIGKADYYAVDYTPTYLCESTSRSISAAMIVYLPTILAGNESWQRNETIRQAGNIDAGIILKPNTISFQHCEAEYPYLGIT
ncbi:MAG: N(5)-(carboxyethyl)ornithine synthase [Bacteroidota bacterium]